MQGEEAAVIIGATSRTTCARPVGGSPRSGELNVGPRPTSVPPQLLGRDKTYLRDRPPSVYRHVGCWLYRGDGVILRLVRVRLQITAVAMRRFMVNLSVPARLAVEVVTRGAGGGRSRARAFVLDGAAHQLVADGTQTRSTRSHVAVVHSNLVCAGELAVAGPAAALPPLVATRAP